MARRFKDINEYLQFMDELEEWRGYIHNPPRFPNEIGESEVENPPEEIGEISETKNLPVEIGEQNSAWWASLPVEG